MFEKITEKLEYSSPEINVISLSDSDVIATSGWGDNLDHSGWT